MNRRAWSCVVKAVVGLAVILLVPQLVFMWLFGFFALPKPAPKYVLADAGKTTIACVASGPGGKGEVLRRLDLAGRRIARDVPLPFDYRATTHVLAINTSGSVAITYRLSDDFPRLTIVSARASAPKTLLTEQPARIAWLDARRIAVLGKTNQVQVYDIETGSVSAKKPSLRMPGEESPGGGYELSGRTVEYGSVEYARVRNLRTGKEVRLPSNTSSPSWSPRGSELAMVSIDDAAAHTLILDCKTGRTRSCYGRKQLVFRVSYDATGRYLVIEKAANAKGQPSELIGCDIRTGKTWRIIRNIEHGAWTIAPEKRSKERGE